MIKRILIIIVLILSIILTGCWDIRTVDELGIISNITIEKSDGDTMIYSIIRPTFEKDKEELIHNTTVESNSVMDAIFKLQQKGSKIYVLGQVNNVLIGKSVAAEGIGDILSQLDHITDFREKAILSVLDGTAEDVKKFRSPQHKRTGILILNTIESSIKKQQIPETRFYQIMNILCLEGREIVLPLVTVDNKDNNIVVESLAVFKGDKMVGKINLSEGIPYIIIASPKVDELIVNIPSEETIEYGIDSLSVTIRKRKIDIITRIEEGIPLIHADINLTVDEKSLAPINTINLESDETFMDKKSAISSIEKVISNYLEKETIKLIEKTQEEFEADIFGFGEKVRVQNNEYFNKINWKEEYPKAKITCSYTVNLRKLGTVK